MQFKIDENLPIEAADALRASGHDALTIHDQHLVGDPTGASLPFAGRKDARC